MLGGGERIKTLSVHRGEQHCGLGEAGQKKLSLGSHETGFSLCGKTTQDFHKKPLAEWPLPGSCFHY